MNPTVEDVAGSMLHLVRECHGKRNLKPLDLTKAMSEQYGASLTRDLGKAAIRHLVESGACIYSYTGGSYIVLNPDAS